MFYTGQGGGMDWARAIERNRDALAPIIAGIFVLLGIEDGNTIERITWRLHRAVQRVLRPAESAVRRLIVVAARGLKVEVKALPPPRPMPKGRIIARGSGSRLSFQLFDPRKNFTARSRRKKVKGIRPRIVVIGHDPTVAAMRAFHAPSPPPAPQPEDDGLVNARPLCRRLRALNAALADLPGQAQRLARWQMRRERRSKLKPTFVWAIRPGAPPGHRRKPVREIDHVLRECQWLAIDSMRHDTS
jgi:hypothetical protein